MPCAPHLIYCRESYPLTRCDTNVQLNDVTKDYHRQTRSMQSDLSNRSSSVRKGETATCLTDRSPVIALKWQFSHIFANTSLFSRLLRQGAWIFLKESHIAEHGETNQNWFRFQRLSLFACSS